MNDKFDQLAKGVAGSATRRQAFKRFGFGLAAMLAAFALPAKAECLAAGSPCDADGPEGHTRSCGRCCDGTFTCDPPDPSGNRQCRCA